MKQIKILFLSLASSFAAFAADLDVSSGQLEGLLAGEEIQKENLLKLKGTIDARDLAALEKLPVGIKTLDLSEVKIQGLTMPSRKYFGRTLFNEDEIPAYTFFKSNVQTLVLPKGITLICEGGMAGSAITEIVVPEGVTSIGDYAFYGCQKLEKVSLPSSLVSVGKGAFGNCVSLKDIDLSGTKITEIPERAFAGSVVLQNVKLPARIRKIGREAFSHTRVSNLDLSGVGEFESYALSSMPYLTTLSINPEAEIGDGLLMDNISLASLTGSPELIPDYFAANCTELNPKDAAANASSFGRYSFANTTSETLVLSNSLTSILSGALSGMRDLTTIDAVQLGPDVPEADATSFEGLDQPNIMLLVDKDHVGNWKNDPYWSLFKIVASDPANSASIESAPSEGIEIACNRGTIVIASSSIINDVRIYTADGRIAYVASPAQDHVEISTSTLPSGIVVIAATDSEGNAKTLTIML